ncbi:MAG: nitroreductase family protein, partial [Mediterranea sp.]|nr:nitroreductase family protein [Mediterranea sp.]
MKTNEVIETLKTRRSTRSYSSQQVSGEDLETILDAATYAPNGMGAQTWHFTAVHNADKLKELNERVKGAFAKSDDPELRKQGKGASFCCYYHAPILVIVSNEPEEDWAGQDCATALQSIFLAARSLGIDSCWINQPALTCDDAEVRAYLTSLGVPKSHKVYGCAALGYGNTPLNKKKPKEGT